MSVEVNTNDIASAFGETVFEVMLNISKLNLTHCAITLVISSN